MGKEEENDDDEEEEEVVVVEEKKEEEENDNDKEDEGKRGRGKTDDIHEILLNLYEKFNECKRVEARGSI